MFCFNEEIINNETIFRLNVETDNRVHFELIRDLLRAIVDNKVCSVTVSSESGVCTSGYICAGVDNNEQNFQIQDEARGTAAVPNVPTQTFCNTYR